MAFLLFILQLDKSSRYKPSNMDSDDELEIDIEDGKLPIMLKKTSNILSNNIFNTSAMMLF